VIGAEAAQSPAFRAALDAGHPVPIDVGPTLADGLAGNLEPGTITFDIVLRTVVDVVTVSEAEIANAMRFLVREHGVVAEGSAAVAVAAVMTGRAPSATGPLAIVITGRNVSTATLTRALAG
jgi:threonine dehydratase